MAGRILGAEPAAHDSPIQARLRSAGLPPLASSAWVEVDLDGLEANARMLPRLLPDGSLLGIVVKGERMRPRPGDVGPGSRQRRRGLARRGDPR